MKFLIDGSAERLRVREHQWPEGIAGQLLTPLTSYKLASVTFAVDNGAYSKFNIDRYTALLAKVRPLASHCLFVTVPDVVGNHKATIQLWQAHTHLCDGFPKAFVAQDGFDGMPEDADVLFVGGSDRFKDSYEALEAVRFYRKQGKHVHVGRVNTPPRYMYYARAGAVTCDGSGVSRFDYMLDAIRRAYDSQRRGLIW